MIIVGRARRRGGDPRLIKEHDAIGSTGTAGRRGGESVRDVYSEAGEAGRAAAQGDQQSLTLAAQPLFCLAIDKLITNREKHGRWRRCLARRRAVLVRDDPPAHRGASARSPESRGSEPAARLVVEDASTCTCNAPGPTALNSTSRRLARPQGELERLDGLCQVSQARRRTSHPTSCVTSLTAWRDGGRLSCTVSGLHLYLGVAGWAPLQVVVGHPVGSGGGCGGSRRCPWTTAEPPAQ